MFFSEKLIWIMILLQKNLWDQIIKAPKTLVCIDIWSLLIVITLA